MKLNPKHKLFCEHYVYKCNSNGTEAYLAVYPKVKSRDVAKVNASKLLTKPNVLEFVKSLRNKISRKLEISAETLTKELAINLELARSNAQYSASNQAAMGIAKLNGLIVDKTEDVTLPEETKKKILSLPLPYLERIHLGEDKLSVLKEYEESLESE